MDLQSSLIEMTNKVPEVLIIPLFDGKEGVNVFPLHHVSLELSYRYFVELLKKVNGAQLKPSIPHPSCLVKSNREGLKYFIINCSLKHYESLKALHLIEGVSGTIIDLELWHLEMMRKGFLYDLC